LLSSLAVPPKLQKPGNAQQTLTVDQRVSLLCSVVEGDEPIAMLWLKDGEPLPVSLGTEVNQVGHDSILRVNRLTAEHMGNYSCQAVNFAGTAAIFFFVQVKGTSHVSRGCHVLVVLHVVSSNKNALVSLLFSRAKLFFFSKSFCVVFFTLNRRGKF
jgi:hypothetical protein